MGRLEHELGQAYMRQGTWPQAQAQFALAKERIGQPSDLARLHIDWSYVVTDLTAPDT